MVSEMSSWVWSHTGNPSILRLTQEDSESYLGSLAKSVGRRSKRESREG